MGNYIKGVDGKFQGSIGQGRDTVPAPTHTQTEVTTTDTDTTISLGAVRQGLPLPPTPVLDDDNPVVTALYGRSGAIDELNNVRAHVQGHTRVDKWDLDEDDNMVWLNGYAAGIRYALRMLTAHPADQAISTIQAEAQEDDDTRVRAAAEAFFANMDDGDSLDAALTREGDGWEYVMTLSDFPPHEQALILTRLTNLTPVEQEALTVLLSENWTGTYAEAVNAARRLTT